MAQAAIQGPLDVVLNELLNLTLPSEGWKTITDCQDVTGVATPCYKPPSAYEHLAPVTWFGTLRLLVLVTTVQFVLILLALVWDLAEIFSARCGKKIHHVHRETGYTPLHFFLDGLDVALSITSCITFIVRAYANPNFPEHLLITVYFVDWAISGAMLVYYFTRWIHAPCKLSYVFSQQAVLNVFTIASSSLTPILHQCWVPFTFLRSLTMNSALRRLFTTFDLPELRQQLILALTDFIALVFAFAGIIFILENLGNPPGWEVEETSNLSFFKSMWYVTVTVSTVGYGDVYPVSFMGKLAGIVFIVVGVFFFSSNISRISALLQSQADGHGRYSAKSGMKHIVLTGKVEPVSLRDFATEFLHPEHDKHTKGGMDLCVVTSDKVDVERYILSGDLAVSRLQMLRGSIPTDLDRIAMPRVQAIFFLGDTLSDHPMKHDGEVLLRAYTATKSNRNTQMYMTLLDPESLNSATDSVALCYTTFKTGLLAQSTFCPGIIPLIGNLLISVDPRTGAMSSTQGKGKRMTREYLHGLQHEIYKVQIPVGYRGSKFGDIVLHNFFSSGILIFALGSTDEGAGEGPGGRKCAPGKADKDAAVKSIAVNPGYEYEVNQDVAFVIAKDDPQHQINESYKNFFDKMRDAVVDEDADDQQDESAQEESAKKAQEESAGRVNTDFAQTALTRAESANKYTTSGGNMGHTFGGDGGMAGQETSRSEQELELSIDRLYAVQPQSDSKKPSGLTRRNRVHPLPSGKTLGRGVAESEREAATKGIVDRVEREISTSAPAPCDQTPQPGDNSHDDLHKQGTGPGPHEPPSADRALAYFPRPPPQESARKMNQSIFDLVAVKRPRLKREIKSPLDLKPNLTHDNRLVDMRDHVIVCGLPQRLHDFLQPFKMGMKHLKGNDEADDTLGLVSVLFLWDGPVSAEQLRAFQGQPESYLLRVPPLNPSSLVMSNPGQAMRMCFLTDYRLASAASEPELIDSGVIFAQRFIRQRFPEAARKYVCEIIENDNIHYLDDRQNEGGSVFISTEPVFSEGMVFSSSLCTNTLAMSFYNKDVLPLVGALLSTRLTNFKGRCSVGEVQLLQAEVPSYLQGVAPVRVFENDANKQNRPYQELFDALMRGEKHNGKKVFGDMLPLGLYRRHDGINENYWYAFTNPAPDTVVRSEDRIFYLKRTTPWTP